MRRVGTVFLGLAIAFPAFAQSPNAAATRKPAAPNPLAESYAAIALGDRISIQSDLIWIGDYNGIANGEFGDRTIAAVKAFQKKQGAKENGVLDPPQRAALTAAAKAKQQAVGWDIVDDAATRTRLGLPLKLLPQVGATKSGSRYGSARGEISIETFRMAEPGTTLQAVFEQQKKEPAGRKTDYNVLRADFFVISGLQGAKKFYVRGQAGSGEVRGVSIVYDQAMDAVMGPVTVAMSSAFVAFPQSVAAIPPPKRKVEYATAIVVSATGYLVTDRRATEGCYAITVEGLGSVDRLADDHTGDLALLRLFGPRNLAPVPLAGDEPKGADVTLVGVPDPQSQGGGGAVATAKARLGQAAAIRTLDPDPGPGFSGAAVLDGQGRVIGVVAHKIPLVAGPPTSGTTAVMVSAATARTYLEGQGVALPAAGSPGLEAARAAIARVICVRK